MTGEAQFLLATLRGSSDSPPDSIDWESFVVLAESHGVLPLFCKKYSGQLPEVVISHLRRLWTSSVFLARELEVLLEQFARHGVGVLPLKGPPLAEALYGSVSQRTCDDLDLLVKQEDFDRARSVLVGMGFIPQDEGNNYHQTFLRNETLVELHFEVASPYHPAFDLNGAWARARLGSFHGQSTRIFRNSDLVLYLTMHAVKHHFARLIWLLDIVRAVESLDQTESAELLAMARAIGVEGALLTTCELARQTFGAMLPENIASAIASNPACAAQAETMCKTILAGPATPQTAVEDASLFIRLEPDSRTRWLHRLRFFLPTQQDRIWATRHGIDTRHMKYLRPFRLLLLYGRSKMWRTLFPGIIDNPRAVERKPWRQAETDYNSIDKR